MSDVTVLTEIARDTLEGLNANPKFLLPKYFYNDEGSLIFQQIMQMPEYYLTDCEYEIFSKQKKDIVDAFCKSSGGFNLIELGSGDGLKTMILLKHLVSQNVSFNYIPIDISEKAHEELIKNINSEIPNLNFTPKT
ncbi:MAG: L-histidine N(alpha)-methyltransferase, partial [Bacteroidales bacterium]|nr:L-histidine N(alpha)-methyltransferase [Bacteroidales bacterium]